MIAWALLDEISWLRLIKARKPRLDMEVHLGFHAYRRGPILKDFRFSMRYKPLSYENLLLWASSGVGFMSLSLFVWEWQLFEKKCQKSWVLLLSKAAAFWLWEALVSKPLTHRKLRGISKWKDNVQWTFLSISFIWGLTVVYCVTTRW